MSDATITISGNLTTEPVLRYTTGGRASLNGGVAVNRRYQANGEWKEEVSFLNFTAYGQIAENIAASCAKGNRVILFGRPELRALAEREGRRIGIQSFIDDDAWATTVRNTLDQLTKEAA